MVRLKYQKDLTAIIKDIFNFALEGLAQWLIGEACFVPVPNSTFHVHVCHPRGTLPVYGACRMFNRPGE